MLLILTFFKKRFSALLHLFISTLFFLVLSESTLYADEEDPRGEISARGCNSIQHTQTKGKAISFSANFGSNSYKIDEGLELSILSEEDAYVTIIDQGSNDTEGRNRILFENKKLLAGKRKRFPPSGYKLTVQPPAGINTFEIVVSREKIAKSITIVGENGRNVELEKSSEPTEQLTRCIMTFEVIE